MSKKEKPKQKNSSVVFIEKLVSNYELKFDYNPRLVAFIKELPKSHRQAKVINTVGENGTRVDVWSWLIKEIEFAKVINFLVDNLMEIKFVNVSESELNRMRHEYISRQQRINDSLKLKSESLDISREDFSFMKIQPYNYQKKAVKFFEINDGRSILGDSPGVGKTLSAIAYAVKNKLRTLVVCPSSLKLNWKDEVEKFTHEKAFVYKYIPSKKTRTKTYTKQESLFHIINYESIRSYIKFEFKHKCSGMNLGKKCGMELTNLEKSYKVCPNCMNKGTIKSKASSIVFFEDDQEIHLDPEEYDLIVMDECHRIKNPDTSWTKIILSAFRDTIPKKILMSGTLIKNKPKELFPIVNFVDPKIWDNFHDFAIKYCGGYKGNFGWDYDGASNLEELYRNMSPILLRRLKKDVLTELPPKTYTNISIELTPEERKTYEKLKSGIKLEDIDSMSQEDVEKINHLVAFQNLKKFLSNVKMERSIELIQDILDSGEKLVVFSQYVDVSQKIFESFKSCAVIFNGQCSIDEKNIAVKSFQEDKNVRLFSGTIMAGGVGITLTAASELMCIDSAWTDADMEQAEDRIHRASSTADKIHIMKLIVRDSIDEDIETMLENKRKTASKALDNTIVKKNASQKNMDEFKTDLSNSKKY